VVIAVVGTGVQSGTFGRIIIRAPINLLRAMLRLNQPAPAAVENVDVTGAMQPVTPLAPPATALSRSGQPPAQSVPAMTDHPRQRRPLVNPQTSNVTQSRESLPPSGPATAGPASSSASGSATPSAGAPVPASEVNPDLQSAPAVPAPDPAPVAPPPPAEDPVPPPPAPVPLPPPLELPPVPPAPVPPAPEPPAAPGVPNPPEPKVPSIPEPPSIPDIPLPALPGL
jgi:hypothetical protein